MQLYDRLRFAFSSFGLLVALVLASTVFGLDDESSESSILLKDATIHSMGPDGTFVGSVLIVDGKIKTVDKEIEAPNDATVYELKGFHLTPGLIDSRSKLWLTPTAIAEGNANESSLSSRVK